MTVLTPVRRLAVSAVSLTAAVVLAAGCSSSTSGSGSPFGGSTGGGTGFSTQAQSGGSAPSSVSAGGGGAASSSSSTSSSGGGSGGGSSSAFCTKLRTLGTTVPNITDKAAVKAIADKWQSLADAAPADIKNDVKQVADALESVASGNLDPNKIQNLSSVFPKITTYISQHCI